MNRVISHILIWAVCGFSAGCGHNSASIEDVTYAVDKEKAFQLVKEIVSFGPRPSGSKNAEKTAEYIHKKCLEYGYQSKIEVWAEQTPQGELTFRNVYATLQGKKNEFAILGSHYDTKMLPSSPGFIGANDSSSSTALLLEIMRVLKSNPNWNGTTITFAFFDGEEAIRTYSDNDGLHGSKKFAMTLKNSGKHNRCKAMILLDMVGDKDLTVTISPDDDPGLTKRLFSIVQKQNTRQHFGFFLHGTIIDDHIPFKEIGIPTLNIIDFNYGPSNYYWHTDLDTLDKLSPESLEIVGNATLALIKEL